MIIGKDDTKSVIKTLWYNLHFFTDTTITKSVNYNGGYRYMKATGIVRRIDDLGRVVIPKEIRRTLRIREGDPLEIYTDAQGGVIFRKYSPVGELSASAGKCAEVLAKITGNPAVICDGDHIVAAAGISKREVMERRVSAHLEQYIHARKSYFSETGEPALIPMEGVNRTAIVMYPIMAGGDVMGAVILLAREGEQSAPGETRSKLVQATAAFLGGQMEDL